MVSPPHSKVKKPVSASGILALTQSPLLYRGEKASVTKETTQYDESRGNSEKYDNKGMHTFNVSPISHHGGTTLVEGCPARSDCWTPIVLINLTRF